MNRTEIYHHVTEKLIAKIEEGVLPWRRSWEQGLPMNFISKRHYNGVNFYRCCVTTFPRPTT